MTVGDAIVHIFDTILGAMAREPWLASCLILILILHHSGEKK